VFILVDMGSWFSSFTSSSSTQHRVSSISNHNTPNNKQTSTIYPTNLGRLLPRYVKGLFTTTPLLHSVKNHYNPSPYGFIGGGKRITKKNKKR